MAGATPVNGGQRKEKKPTAGEILVKYPACFEDSGTVVRINSIKDAQSEFLTKLLDNSDISST